MDFIIGEGIPDNCALVVSPRKIVQVTMPTGEIAQYQVITEKGRKAKKARKP